MSTFTKDDFDSWRFSRDDLHINGGHEFFGYGHRCITQPRLLVIDKYFRKDRSTQRSYVVDGRTACATIDEALAALSVPPAVTEKDIALLRSLPDTDWSRPEPRVPFLPLADMGLVEWGRDNEDHVTLRLTDAGRALTKS